MIDLNTLVAVFVFVIGACIGSFLNVVALRGLSGESIVFPPSKCPKCNNKLNWYTNIPIISYCFLGGKCQFCKEHISIQYPVVEFLNALLWLFCFLEFGYTAKTLFLCILASLFIVIAITDFKESVVIDAHTYIIIALGLLYNAVPFGAPFGEAGILQSILGILAGTLFFEAAARTGYLFAGTRAFGEGDTLIAMGIGAFFGWKMLFVIIFMSVILQAVLTLPVLFHKSIKEKAYKSAAAYSMLVLCVVLVYIFRAFDVYTIFPLILILLLMVCIILLWALCTILKDMKNKKETDNFLYLPFGPALVLAGLLAIFFQSEIVGFIKNMFFL